MATCLGLFQYARLARRLTNSGATIQRIVSRILCDICGKSAKGCRDHLSIGTDTAAERITYVAKLLDRLLAAGMRVKFSKCAFGKTTVETLGLKLLITLFSCLMLT